MFALAFAIGIFSYGIFLLGILGWLYVPIIIGITIVYWICFVILKKNTLRIALLLCKKRVATESKSLLIILLLIWMALQMSNRIMSKDLLSVATRFLHKSNAIRSVFFFKITKQIQYTIVIPMIIGTYNHPKIPKRKMP